MFYSSLNRTLVESQQLDILFEQMIAARLVSQEQQRQQQEVIDMASLRTLIGDAAFSNAHPHMAYSSDLSTLPDNLIDDIGTGIADLSITSDGGCFIDTADSINWQGKIIG